MNARILSIGTELTIGQTVDTNAAWLAQQLAALGIPCPRFATVGDDRAAIGGAIREAAGDADVVLVSGGLGPTLDDLTRFALADVLGTELVLHAASLEHIAEFFRRRRRSMPDANQVQAMIPRGAEAIENTCGTAPGMRARVMKADVYLMPGVPVEMRTMFDRDIRPRLASASGGAVILQHTLHTFGMPESLLGEAIADLMRADRNPHVGTSAADLVISVRINARGASGAEAARLLNADVAEIRRRLGDVVFGEQGETLAGAVATRLTTGGQTIATAESCTGGLIAKRLTDIPGSSSYFVQGLVTYANEAKHRLLGIPMELIERHGAVSAEVAEAMAASCRRLAGTDYALSATGIAGPTGATPTKPVGLVYLGLADATGVTTKELQVGDTLPRSAIRDRTAKIALNWVRLAVIRR